MQHLAVHTPRSRLCRGRCVCRAHSTPPLPPRHPISFPPRQFIQALPIPSSLFLAGAIGTFSSKGTTHGVALVSVPLLKSVSDCDLETVGSPCLLCEVRTARTGVLIRLNSTHVGCSHTHSWYVTFEEYSKEEKNKCPTPPLQAAGSARLRAARLGGGAQGRGGAHEGLDARGWGHPNP